MVKIREIVQKALIWNYLTIEAENKLRQLLQSKYEEEDLDAFIELQLAVMNGRVRQESRELMRSGC
ncbi:MULTISPECIES: hypothetical protein [Aerosakkonema]|uniref:hypothetical protein n=1 Tax=Aerosakkonema TaxID=1246629 RepID=UPI0035B95062